MSAIFNSLNAHTFPIFHPILMKLVQKSMVFRPLSYKTYMYLLTGLRSPLMTGMNVALFLTVVTNYTQI